jgi:pimeloyl-ACP methyl ester carboxylesterase
MPDPHHPAAPLRVRDAGEGSPPLVLLHAFPLQSRMWDEQLRSLSGAHRVVAPDLRGAGDSPGPDDPAAYSVASWVDDVLGLLDERGLERPVLVGAGEGGTVALAVARRRPERLGGLVLVGTGALGPTGEQRAVAERQAAWLSRGGAVGALADWVIGSLADQAPRRPEVVKEAKFMLEEAEPDGLLGALHALTTWEGVEPGPTGVPTLLVRGELDQLTTALGLRQLQRSLPGADRAEVPDAGHLPNMEAPEAFDAVLERWLAGR